MKIFKISIIALLFSIIINAQIKKEKVYLYFDEEKHSIKVHNKNDVEYILGQIVLGKKKNSIPDTICLAKFKTFDILIPKQLIKKANKHQDSLLNTENPKLKLLIFRSELYNIYMIEKISEEKYIVTPANWIEGI